MDLKKGGRLQVREMHVERFSARTDSNVYGLSAVSSCLLDTGPRCDLRHDDAQM